MLGRTGKQADLTLADPELGLSEAVAIPEELDDLRLDVEPLSPDDNAEESLVRKDWGASLPVSK